MVDDIDHSPIQEPAPQQMPSVDQMASQLGHQGLDSPAQPIQASALPETISAEALTPTHPAEAAPHYSNHWVHMFMQRPTHNLIAIGLTLQGLFGIYKSVSFILVDYQFMEQQLAQNLITQDDASRVAVKAGMIIISTFLTMFFALKLTILRSKVAKHLHTVIGLALFLGNAIIFDFLKGLPLVDQWGALVNQVLTAVKTFITDYRSL